MRSPCSIAVFGGCHVDGYIVGASHAFPTQMRKLLASAGVDAEVHVCPYVRLRDSEKVDDVLGRGAVDIVVLQLGNFEGEPGLGLARRFRRGASRSLAPRWPCDAVFKRTARHFVKDVVRRTMNPARSTRCTRSRLA